MPDAGRAREIGSAPAVPRATNTQSLPPTSAPAQAASVWRGWAENDVARSKLNLWLRPTTVQHPVERAQSVLLQILLVGILATIAVGVILSGFVLRLSVVTPITLARDVGVLVAVAVALAVLRRGHFALAVGLVIVALLAGLAHALLSVGLSASQPILIALAIPVTLAGLLAGRAALVLTVVCSVGIVVGAGLVDPTPGVVSAQALFVYVLAIGLMALLLDQFGSALRQALGASVARQQELERIRDELERTNAAEQAARADAEAALRIRDEFLSVASHELKTPVSSLLASAQLVHKRWQTEGAANPQRLGEGLARIERQSTKLSRLVMQLLDRSRLQAGKLALVPQPADLAELAREAVSIVQTTADQHTIEVTGEASLPAEVDGLHVEQVLLNLLDNAVKYTPAGGTIEVRVERASEATARVMVCDSGPGIPADERERIFDQFFRTRDAVRAPGMGLGLYLAKEIVDRHGGRLWAQFPECGGTCMVVELPTRASDR